MSGFFAPQQAFAAATVTAATGGTNVSINTTSAGGTGVYKSLSGPGINELVAGDISTGVHTITLPTGWEFENSTITITPFGSDIGLLSNSVTPDSGLISFSFEVMTQSTTGGFIGFGGLKVRPTGTTPSADNMTYSGAGIVGVSGSTNFGTLSTVPGTVTKLAFTTEPGGAVYGSVLSPQPVVKTQDQFGNNSISGLTTNLDVTLALTGTGALQGTGTLNIGTSAGNGTVTFIDLKVDGVGATGTKGLTASAGTLTDAVSGTFVISSKPLTATVTVNDKSYDGNNSAVITNVTLNGFEAGDTVTVGNQGTATFASPNANTGIVVTSNGVTITGAHAGNYSFGGTATGTADITPLGITITTTAGQTKIYGSADTVFAYTNDPLIGTDGFTGALSRVAGEDVNTYDYTLGTLSAGSNYSLSLASGTFGITKKTLTVTATGGTKVYDANTTAPATLSDDRVGGDELTLGYTATFIDNENVGTGKPVSVTGIAITGGADAGNYVLGNTTAATTANVTAKPLTVSFTTTTNKTYNGSETAAITGRSLGDVIGLEVVGVTGGSASFADKHIGTAKTVTATGFTLTGADAGNYSIGTINTTTGNVNPRPITITAVTDDKIYDGTTDSDGTPVVTSTFSPPVAEDDTASFIQTYDNENVGTVKTLTPSGTVTDGNSGANYSYNFVTDTTGVITVKSINVTAQTDTKTYDGTTDSIVAPVVDLLETGDIVSIVPIQTYDTENVGINKTLTPSGLVINDGNGGANYTVVPVTNNTGVINAKGLTVSGATTISKIYDGGLVATVNFGSAELVGIVSGEEALVSLVSTGYSATYVDKNVALTDKTVTVSGLALAGDGAGNYSLTQPTLTDGVITPATLTVTATGGTRVYDGTTDATGIVTLSDNRVGGDELTLTHTATFDGPNGKNVDTEKPVSVTGIAITGGADAGNYVLGNTETDTMADITQKPITATLTALDKTYDGDADADIISVTLVDFVGGDDVAPDFSSATATFEDANVDEDKDVDAEGITLTGADALNYFYNGTAVGTATINPLGITGSFTADNKVYDGTTAATILTRSLTDVLSGDIVNVVLTGGTADFADENVGNDIVVTEMVAMTLTGSAAGNYELTDVNDTMADITKAPLTITANDMDRLYGDANPTLTATYVGFVNSETASVLDAPVSLSTTAVDASPVDTYQITASGASDNNYEITHAPGVLTVTPAPLTVTANAQNKIYGEADPTFSYTSSGFKNSENESIFTGVLERLDTSEDVDNYVISQGTLSAGGNYAIAFTGANLTINPRSLTITAVTDTKTYDGDTTSDETPTITEGELQFGETPAFTQSYNTADAGNNKVLTASGIVNDGNSGANYTYNFSNTVAGEIIRLEITVTPNDGQSKVYGQPDPAFTYTNTPLISPDVFTGALSRVAGEDVATYAYTLGTLENGLGNYTLTLVSGTFAITKATPVITWNNPADIVYGAALSGTQLNATADVAGAFVYTPVSGTVLNAGIGQTLSVAFTPTDTANYNNAEETVLITVTPASLTVTADNKSKEYGASDPALTYGFSGLVNGDTDAVFSGALTRIAGEAVGTYGINQGTLLAGSNYVITYNSGTLTITDTIAPTVVSHTPSFNALNISPTTAIVVTFSEPVDVESGDVSFSPTISGGFTISNSGTSVVTITPNNPLADNTTYTITLAGAADINGNPLPTYGNIKFTTATNYSINLNANASGWNLISLPVVPSNTAIATVLGSAADNIDAVWTYDPTNPNAVNGWLIFVPGNPEGTNNLTLMTTGFGYWVSVTDNANLSGAGTLLIAGPTPPPSRSLQTGWNLIGYYQLPNENDSIPVSAFASIGAPGVGYNGLWGFDNTTGSFNSVTTINSGDAFWISLPSVKTYTPSNIE